MVAKRAGNSRNRADVLMRMLENESDSERQAHEDIRSFKNLLVFFKCINNPQDVKRTVIGSDVHELEINLTNKKKIYIYLRLNSEYKNFSYTGKLKFCIIESKNGFFFTEKLSKVKLFYIKSKKKDTPDYLSNKDINKIIEYTHGEKSVPLAGTKINFYNLYRWVNKNTAHMRVSIEERINLFFEITLTRNIILKNKVNYAQVYLKINMKTKEANLDSNFGFSRNTFKLEEFENIFNNLVDYINMNIIQEFKHPYDYISLDSEDNPLSTLNNKIKQNMNSIKHYNDKENSSKEDLLEHKRFLEESQSIVQECIKIIESPDYNETLKSQINENMKNIKTFYYLSLNKYKIDKEKHIRNISRELEI